MLSLQDMSSSVGLVLSLCLSRHRHRHRQAYRPEFLLFEVVCDDPLRVFFLAVVPLLSDSPSLLLMLACFTVTALLTGVGIAMLYIH
jgi:hypothetical protein